MTEPIQGPARWGSLRTRTTIAAMVIVAVALLIGSVFLISRQHTALTDVVETGAGLRSKDLATSLVDGSLPADVAVPVEDEAFAQIVDSGGRVVRASPNIDGQPPVVDPGTMRGGTEAVTMNEPPVGDDPFRVVAHQVDVNGEPYTVIVGASLEPVADAVDELIRTLIVGSSAIVLLVGAIAWVVVGRALRPVEEIRAEVELISGTELARRVPETGGGDEIDRLAHTMNSMLDRIETATDRQRRFVADASHEMRSPLTAIRAQLEVDLAHPAEAAWQDTENEVLGEALRLQRLVDDLLLLARADAPTTQKEWEVLDLDDIVLAEARKLRIRAQRNVDARAVSAVQVRGDRDALVRAIGNLMSNAERHARDTVTVTLGADDQGALLTIADDGPGVPPAQRESIFDRFARGDAARSRDQGGAGLGLAISREIAVAHGATLELASDDCPGATFQLRLPAAATVDGIRMRSS